MRSMRHLTRPRRAPAARPPPPARPQIFRLMRTLVELCGTLEEVPEERHIFMRLTYHVRLLAAAHMGVRLHGGFARLSSVAWPLCCACIPA